MSDQQKRPRGRPRLGEESVVVRVTCPLRLRERLRAVAEAEGVKMAEIAREGIEREVKRREKRLR